MLLKRTVLWGHSSQGLPNGEGARAAPGTLPNLCCQPCPGWCSSSAPTAHLYSNDFQNYPSSLLTSFQNGMSSGCETWVTSGWGTGVSPWSSESPYLRAFVGIAAVRVPWRRVTTVPRTALWLGHTRCGATVAFSMSPRHTLLLGESDCDLDLSNSAPGSCHGPFGKPFTGPSGLAFFVPSTFLLAFFTEWGRFASFTFFGGFYQVGDRGEHWRAVQHWNMLFF
jgi:hypothetical protein